MEIEREDDSIMVIGEDDSIMVTDEEDSIMEVEDQANTQTAGNLEIKTQTVKNNSNHQRKLLILCCLE